MRPADAIATVTLLPTNQGGRAVPTPFPWFGCLAMTPGGNFDVRMQLGSALAPGTTAVVPLWFLSPDLVAPFLGQGATFTLWEGGPIGSVHIDNVSHALAAE